MKNRDIKIISIILFFLMVLVIFIGKQSDTIDLFDFIPLWLYNIFRILLFIAMGFNIFAYSFFRYAKYKRPNHKIDIVNKGLHETKILILGTIIIYLFFYVLYPLFYGLPE